VRNRAFQELSRLGELAGPELQAALAKTEALEPRQRIEGLLKRLEGPLQEREKIRNVRAIEVLEEIGTPQAKSVLETLAKGAAAARETEEAKASLERLNARAMP